MENRYAEIVSGSMTIRIYPFTKDETPINGKIQYSIVKKNDAMILLSNNDLVDLLNALKELKSNLVKNLQDGE